MRIEGFPRFGTAENLKDEEDVATYLTVVLEESGASAPAEALGTVARACEALGVKLVAMPERPQTA